MTANTASYALHHVCTATIFKPIVLHVEPFAVSILHMDILSGQSSVSMQINPVPATFKVLFFWPIGLALEYS
ncbi:hypothetical protein QN277_021661 [Acacia crassicarpa]|uniref:Uncharacterized protein n=1 Tax=Acacia crassicarpa TaxID=499986 RepID=A0AAE1MTA8_9FABA|nr:hypothetical protein QN277_021661 [Acacia crassicarpa]